MCTEPARKICRIKQAGDSSGVSRDPERVVQTNAFMHSPPKSLFKQLGAGRDNSERRALACSARSWSRFRSPCIPCLGDPRSPKKRILHRVRGKALCTTGCGSQTKNVLKSNFAAAEIVPSACCAEPHGLFSGWNFYPYPKQSPPPRRVAPPPPTNSPKTSGFLF